MKTEEQLYTDNIRGFTFKGTSIGDYQSTFFCKYNFYWNSTEHSTLIQFEIIVSNNKFIDMITIFFPKEEYELFCSNLDKYLKSINNDLVQYESINIKKPLLTIWSYIANLSNEKNIGKKTDFCYSN